MSVFSQCLSNPIDRGISVTVHGKDVVDGLNAIDKRYIYIYQLMCHVQFPGSKTFDSQIIMHSFKHKDDISLAKKFQKHLSKYHQKHGVANQVKYSKRASKRTWTYIDYHVQDNADVAHKYVRMYCDANQFPALPFFGPHPKSHGSRGLSKHYLSRFDLKLGRGICTILRIPCVCVGFTSMMDKPWISGIPPNKKSQ